MKIELGYGAGTQILEIEERNLKQVLLPGKMDAEMGEQELIEEALDHPEGTPGLERLAEGKHNAVIVTSDITRPMPSYKVLPSVLERLNRAGIPDEQITVVFAVGSHRKQTEAEKKRLVGDEIYSRVRCVDSSESRMIHLGETKEGTPVDIAETVARADLLVCLGNVEYHFFAGYSGGAKAVMPGASTRAAIRINHRKMIHPMARAGILEGNPVREDLEEAARICGVDFILNVVLDEHKRIVFASAGDMLLAHRKGCRFLDRFYRCEIERPADIVVVSQGGEPKDLNLYQTQKALANAEYAVKEGGIIILAGACPEGLGEAVFEQWMTQAGTVDEILERIQRDFQVGGHKAASFAKTLKKAEIYLVSGLKDELVRDIFMTPFASVQEAYCHALERAGKEAEVIVMPYGGSTLPVVRGEEEK